jgi:hypothetical protein
MTSVPPLAAAVAAGALGVAAALAPPRPDDLARLATTAVRPAMLPFAWNSLEAAAAGGDAAEAFARAQNLMRLMPEWSDGYAAFAYRFVLAHDDRPAATPVERAERVRARLELATAWLASARPRAGRYEPSVLLALAFLPEVAVRHEPALGELLAPRGGAAALADVWLAEAERLFPTAAIRAQRTFFAPSVAAGLLAAGNVTGAAGVLAVAIERSRDVADQQLAAEWRARLDEVRRFLDGDRDVDLTAVRADTRLEPLHPHLR